MRKSARVPLIVLLVIALLLALHLALPTLVRNVLNEQFAEMGDYRGHVEGVDLAWWRGAYRLNGLSIEKADGAVQVPFLEIPIIDLGVSWQALWRDRAIVASARLVEPRLNFVDSAQDSGKQTGEGVDWRETLEEMLPIRLNELQIDNGTLSFRNFSSDPPVNIYASEVNLAVYNLSNTQDPEGTRDASLEGTARLLDHAPMELDGTFDPLLRMEDFELRFRVTDVELTRLNELSAAYGKFDFKAGTGDLVIEAQAQDSQLDGYIKPLLRNVEVFDWEQDVRDEDKGLLRGLWEALVGGGQALLKNQPRDQLATRVELSGSLKDADISAFEAFINILHNAFVEAFSARFESAPQPD